MLISIQPDLTLENTARVLGEILGLPFTLDDSGYFEEFPAYSSPPGDTRFALLGPPDVKVTDDTPRFHYELQVCKFSGTVQQHDELVLEIQRRIAVDGRLSSDLLGEKQHGT